MGFTNIYAKYLVVIFLLWVSVANAQVNTTTIPGKLKIKTVPNTVAAGDSALTTDPLGNVKKAVFRPLATGINGLNGTTTIGLGGTLSQNTLLNDNSFSLTINQASPLDIILFQQSTTPVARINGSGEFLGGGAGNYADVRNSNIRTTANGTIVTRDIGDTHTNLTVTSTNYLATGLLLNLQNYYRSPWFIGNDGDIQHFPTVAAFGGHGYGYFMAGHVKATANGDLLIGMDIEPVFGTSSIATTGSLVGGSGYPNGTQYATFTGGTGTDAVAQVTVVSGVVTSYLLVDNGLNYTNGDVISFIMEDSSGTPVGSGGSITVTGINSFSGVTQYTLRTKGLDVYDIDYSSSYTSRTKVDKGYSDTHNAGVLLTSTTTAPIPFPKMTTTQKNAISPVTEGMVVYDITLHKISYYDGTVWQAP